MLDPIVTALKDDDDDVRAVAASALLPVAESLVTFAPNRVSAASFTCSRETLWFPLAICSAYTSDLQLLEDVILN